MGNIIQLDHNKRLQMLLEKGWDRDKAQHQVIAIMNRVQNNQLKIKQNLGTTLK